MPGAPARFTKADISRAVKAVADAGVSMAVEITRDGTIRIVPFTPEKPSLKRPGVDGKKEIRM